MIPLIASAPTFVDRYLGTTRDELLETAAVGGRDGAALDSESVSRICADYRDLAAERQLEGERCAELEQLLRTERARLERESLRYREAAELLIVQRAMSYRQTRDIAMLSRENWLLRAAMNLLTGLRRARVAVVIDADCREREVVTATAPAGRGSAT